jgi:two-component system sensor histidine kinase KdpD
LRQRWPTPGAIALGLALVAGTSAALAPFRPGMSRAIPALVLVIPVVAAAFVGRQVAALVTAIAAAAAFSYSFVPPYDKVSIASAEDWAALGVFLAVAFVVGTLVANEAQRRRAAEQQAEEVRALLAERERLREEADRVAVMEVIDQQRSALLRSVSHDLRTPLATIRAIASELRAGTDFPAETRDELLDLVGDEAERLNRIVENLLGLTRIETGALQPDRQALALDELVDDRARKLDRLLRHVTVERDLPVDLPLVDADHVQLVQVFSNLLENAARHAPPGSVVRVAATHVGPWVEVSVQDEGDGIPEVERPRIFEPFRPGQGSTSTGVGLAVCKAIIEAHGGRIGFDTRAGCGTRFWFTVPVHGG